jgi:hypothetical protein
VDSPHQNYVQLTGHGFEGIEEATKELQEADRAGWSILARKNYMYSGKKTPLDIANNAKRTLRDRYLTPAATMCYTRAALRQYAKVLNGPSWGPKGPQLLPGHGVAPDISKGKSMAHLKGDIEVGVWRMLGGPEWPPAA